MMGRRRRSRPWAFLVWGFMLQASSAAAAESASTEELSPTTKNQNSWKEEMSAEADFRNMKDILDDMDDMVMPDDDKNSDGGSNTTEFCRGMYMTMFMDGFHWTLLKPPPAPQCLNYFVRSWRLENAGKFKGAMVFSFLLAVLVEGLSAARVAVVRHCAKQPPNRQRRHGLHALLTLIYGIQALLGYIVMIITMSFSIELLASVIGGLVMGNALFLRHGHDNDDSCDAGDERSRRSLSSRQRVQDTDTNNREEEVTEVQPLIAGGSSSMLRRRV